MTFPNHGQLEVEYRALDSLIPYANNARTHSEDQVAQIAASIKEFGWTNPVLVDGDSGVIAGHGRILGARKLGIDEIPVIELSGLSDAQKRAYVLADNKLAQNAGWDNDLLSIELGGLGDEGFDLQLTGFHFGEISSLQLDANDPYEEWTGMPEFDHDDKTAFRTVALHFKTKQEVDRFAKQIGQQITDKTRFIWFSGTEIDRYADKQYKQSA